ncbi:MAG: hypothetical protein ACOC1G_00325 [Phycisphaeraceae bacterium]
MSSCDAKHSLRVPGTTSGRFFRRGAMRSPRRSIALGLLPALMLMPVLFTQSGCWLAATAFGGEKTYKVQAQYRGLEGKTAAVLVSADEYLLFTQPQVPQMLIQAVSRELAAHVDNIRVVNPRRVAAFEQRNPYWSTTPYTRLIEELEVDRLVIVDLAEYRLHEPGNKHVWRGVINASVSVAEAEQSDPDQLAFSTQVRALFPEGRELGLVNADREQIELGTLKLFSLKVGRVFYDHEIRK